MQNYFNLTRTMSVVPGMWDFNRDHAAHKPYALKDRDDIYCSLFHSLDSFFVDLGTQFYEISQNPLILHRSILNDSDLSLLFSSLAPKFFPCHKNLLSRFAKPWVLTLAPFFSGCHSKRSGFVDQKLKESCVSTTLWVTKMTCESLMALFVNWTSLERLSVPVEISVGHIPA